MKRSEKLFSALAVTAALAIVVFIALSSVADKKRRAARATIEPPEMVATMEAVRTGEIKRGYAPGNADVDRVRKSVESFAELFRIAAVLEDDGDWHELSMSMWDEGVTEQLRMFVRRIQPLLDEIRAVAAQGGPAQALDFSQARPDVEHFKHLREFARLLRADATVAVAQGDFDRFVDDVVATMQLSDALAVEPTLMSQLVRFAVYGIANSALERHPAGALSDDQYERLMQQLAQAGRREEFADCFAGEAIRTANFFDDPVTSGTIFTPEQVLMRLYNNPLGKPLRDLDEVSALEILARIQDAARLPYFEALPELQAIDDQIESLSWLRPYSRLTLSHLTATFQAQARHEASVVIAQIGLTVERFHEEFGAYPPSLEQIAPLLPGNVLPLDPFTGAPYIYRPADDSFLLYSVNADQVDDGGRMGQTSSQLDLVWRGEREEQ
jgi:hypothetical protein